MVTVKIYLFYFIFIFAWRIGYSNSTVSSVTTESISTTINGLDNCNDTLENCTNSTTSSVFQEKTTNKPMTTTQIITTAPPLISKNLEKNKLNSDDLCFCDLTENVCDINCCCDAECNDNDISLFSKCIEVHEVTHTPKYCFEKEFIWKNRSQFKTVVGPHNLLCIVKDNLPEKIFTIENQYVTNVDEVNNLIIFKHKWKSSTKLNIETIVLPKEGYRSGSNILTVSNNKILNFETPSKVFNNACISNKKIKFLENFSSSCTTETPNIFTENNFYLQSYIIASPAKFNTSWLQNISLECPINICIPIKAYKCERHFQNCSKFIFNTKLCLNEICPSEIKYDIIYNTTIGITKVNAYLHFKNTSKKLHFEIKTTINYLNVNQTNTTYFRSGNPGYVYGKPILSFNTVNNLNENNTSTKNTNQIIDSSGLHLVLPTNKNNFCVLNKFEKYEVKFGVNSYQSCILRFNIFKFANVTICKQIQHYISNLFFLNGENLSMHSFNKFIGAYGNANRSNSKEWIKVLINDKKLLTSTNSYIDFVNNMLTCNNIATKLAIDILFTNATLKRKNNAKVVAAVFNLVNENKNFRILNFNVDIQLKFQVSFIDVTNNKYSQVKFASAPSFEVKLPYDFFYPFYSASPKKFPSFYVPILNILIFFLNSFKSI